MVHTLVSSREQQMPLYASVASLGSLQYSTKWKYLHVCKELINCYLRRQCTPIPSVPSMLHSDIVACLCVYVANPQGAGYIPEMRWETLATPTQLPAGELPSLVLYPPHIPSAFVTLPGSVPDPQNLPIPGTLTSDIPLIAWLARPDSQDRALSYTMFRPTSVAKVGDICQVSVFEYSSTDGVSFQMRFVGNAQRNFVSDGSADPRVVYSPLFQLHSIRLSMQNLFKYNGLPQWPASLAFLLLQSIDTYCKTNNTPMPTDDPMFCLCNETMRLFLSYNCILQSVSQSQPEAGPIIRQSEYGIPPYVLPTTSPGVHPRSVTHDPVPSKPKDCCIM